MRVICDTSTRASERARARARGFYAIGETAQSHDRRETVVSLSLSLRLRLSVCLSGLPLQFSSSRQNSCCDCRLVCRRRAVRVRVRCYAVVYLPPPSPCFTLTVSPRTAIFPSHHSRRGKMFSSQKNRRLVIRGKFLSFRGLQRGKVPRYLRV